MKKFKIADCWISALLISTFIIVEIIRMDTSFIIGYFTVGAWQLTSMLIHFFKESFIYPGGKRHHYHRLVVLLFLLIPGLYLLTCLSESLAPLLLIAMIALLLAAPFMAIYYTWLCYDEAFIKMKRPLALLK